MPPQWRCSRVDRETFGDIEAQGVGTWLGNLQKELVEKTYRPKPLLRVWIPKNQGAQRPSNPFRISTGAP